MRDPRVVMRWIEMKIERGEQVVIPPCYVGALVSVLLSRHLTALDQRQINDMISEGGPV